MATGDLKHSPTFLSLLHALEFMSQPTALCRLPVHNQSCVHDCVVSVIKRYLCA